jgi:alkanesulfonate monooxygenase SsuD/methylene tetrahydromethanopterin reductase-like flavin-dependent oxidoreductase (luciferase family)
VPALALGAGLVDTPELIVDRVYQYSAAGVELLMLHFHPMMDGLCTFIDRIPPKLSHRTRSEAFPEGVAL